MWAASEARPSRPHASSASPGHRFIPPAPWERLRSPAQLLSRAPGFGWLRQVSGQYGMLPSSLHQEGCDAGCWSFAPHPPVPMGGQASVIIWDWFCCTWPATSLGFAGWKCYGQGWSALLSEQAKVHTLQAPRPQGGLHPGPILHARKTVVCLLLGAGFWKRTEQAVGGQQPPEGPVKAGLKVQNPVCVETSWETRQDRSWKDKPNSRWGPCDACPLQQDLKSQSAPLTGCKAPWKLLLSPWSAAVRAAEPRPAAESLFSLLYQPSHVQDGNSSRRGLL